MDIANKQNSRLTAGQEKFCQEIAKGETQRQAYYTAYTRSKKWKPEVVDAKASELRKNGKVLVRLKELSAKTEIQNDITRNDLVEQLKKIGFANIDISNLKVSEKIKAIEVMSKILGYDKLEIVNTQNEVEIDPLSKSFKELAGEL